MTDEAYVFHLDVAEKKSIGRSAFFKNAGSKGAVKFPSDYLTKKELSAMNGEVATYRMTDPMTWKEFKKLPDDLKKVYIQNVRERFHAKSKDFQELFGCSHYTFDKEVARLGLGVGTKMNRTQCDRESFKKWLNRDPIEDPVKKESESVAAEAIDGDTLCAEGCVNAASVASICGSMSFVGSAKAALDTVSELLKDLNCHITITWNTEVD